MEVGSLRVTQGSNLAVLQVTDDGGACQSGIGGEGDEKCSASGYILNVERSEFPNRGPKQSWEFQLTPLEGWCVWGGGSWWGRLGVKFGMR